MRLPSEIIRDKRDGKELSAEDIRSFVEGLTSGQVTDYQATAFLMAVYFQRMSFSETAALTQAMLASGERYDFAKLEGVFVDKHSTGGIGDKVSLILAPLAAACGLKVPMMSGRGLGHSGGTLDKLDAIPGYRHDLSRERFEQILAEVGCSIIGQSARMAPADKKLYALRDVTATVECIPLICGSILSKKLAEGAQGLLLDVKTGSGAFMPTPARARELARWLVKVATKLGLPARAVVTDMSQPLGYSVGNALEVIESVEILKGERLLCPEGKPPGTPLERCSADLKELTIALCAHMLEIGKKVKNLAEGRRLAHARLADGSAWKRFQEMVRAHGGDASALDRVERMGLAPRTVSWNAKKKGFLAKMDAREIGLLLVELGGGRKRAEDRVDPGVGFVFHRKLGSRVIVGDPLVTVYAPASLDLAPLEARFHAAIKYAASRPSLPKLILDAAAK
ncbi:MAG: thymidine phosphorylase [Bdellovibrionales bacterium]|nr:thymidine phosphorylase [Bdellovibrionales bacterium]